jgi:hypothetical protein
VVAPIAQDYSHDHPGDVKFTARFLPIENLGAAVTGVAKAGK